MRVDAWRVHDTGLVAAPGPFRRLPGRVRHHQGTGGAWPVRVVLELTDAELVVRAADGDLVGRWRRADVTIRPMSPGPPATFVVDVLGESHLLAAAADAATAALTTALPPPQARQ